jgi:hypothetical protein
MKRDDGRFVNVKRKTNWKPVSNSEAQVPLLATNVSLAWMPLPGELLADHIRRLTHLHERLLSSCHGARSVRPEDYQTSKNRWRNPRGRVRLPGQGQRGVSRAINNEKEPVNA